MVGNPLIKEEMELQSEIKDLKMEKSRYSENIFDLQDKIRVKIPAAIQQTEAHIESFRNDFSLANNQQKVITEDGKAIYPIKIGDTVYNDRTAGGDALKAAIGGNIGKLAEGKTVLVGEYRGMQLSLLFDTMTKTTKACLAGEKHHYCDLNPETNTGNIIRLDNLINNIAKDIKQSEEALETMHTELEQMKIDVEKPFPKAEDLLRAETRLEEVHDQLTKLELTDDTANKDIFERLCAMFPDVMSGKKEAVKYEAGETFDPLSVELHGNVFSMAHTYTQNGDLMYDPLVYFKVDYANEKVLPVSFENSSAGFYQEFDIEAEPTPESVHAANSVLDFVDTWLDNIEEQGYLDNEPQEESKEKEIPVGVER